MKCLLLLLLLFGIGAAVYAGSEAAPDITAMIKREHPPKPEAGGLRLEVTAVLDDAMTSDGTADKWLSAFLNVEIALHNVSNMPITVPTTAYDEKPWIAPWGIGLERVLIKIDSVKFQGKPTVFVPSRYTPVALAPGERVMLLRHRASVSDRKQADALKELNAVFIVARTFDGPQEWWRGHLNTYVDIERRIDPDKYIAEAKVRSERYEAQKAAEKDPNYGKANAARIAALIAGSDEAHIRDEMEKETAEVIVRDVEWIKQVSAAVAATSLPRSVHCFCIGWRTANFYKDGQKVVSVAAIHGSQLRIHWPGGGGDYPIDEADWKTVQQALESPRKATQ